MAIANIGKPGYCNQCGRQDERTLAGKKRCEHCRKLAAESARRRREKARANRECTSCHKQDNRTLAGKCLCQSCYDKQRVMYRGQTRDKLYVYRLENHLCSECGEKMPDNWFLVRCEKCTKKQHELYLKRYKPKRPRKPKLETEGETNVQQSEAP